MVSIRVDHYFHGIGLSEGQFTELKQILMNNQGIEANIATRLGTIETQMAAAAAKEEQMADDVRAALDDLTQQVAGLEDAEESLITYVQGLAAELQANAGNAQAVRDIAAKLQSDSRRMADAVLTPASGGGTGGGGGGTVTPTDGGSTTGGGAGDGGAAPGDGGAAPTGRRG